MRYIEAQDINGKPLFEGDTLSLTIKDKFFGGSYFGKFCDFYNVDEAKIQVLENSNFLQVKYVITFYRDNMQVVTNQENAYWEYYNSLIEKSLTPEKTLKDFNDIDNALEFSTLESEEALFFRYLLSKGVEKVDGTDGKEVPVPDESLLIKTKLDENIYIGDKIIVKLNDEWKEKLVKYPASENYLIDDVTHALFEFERVHGQFNYRVNLYLTDSMSNCKVHMTRLNKDGEQKKYELADKIFYLNQGDPLRDHYQHEMEQLYKKKEFIYLEKYKLFLGINGEINLLNYFNKQEFELSKVL